MFQLTHRLPKDGEFHMACSGGVDSMAALNWLRRGGRVPKSILYVNHNTGEYSNKAHHLVTGYARIHNIRIDSIRIQKHKEGTGSREEYWRDQRYAFFDGIQAVDPLPIVLGHHLDDCLEQYVSNKLIRPRKAFTIPYKGKHNTIRPFRTWKKSSIREYAQRWKVQFIEDPSNKDTTYTRNKIRHDVLPTLLEMNPGLYRFVAKQIMLEAKEETNNLIL
jgi:tRNA(Ile)-lysidine synthase